MEEYRGKFYFIVYYGSLKKYSVVGTNSLVGRVLNISEHVQEGLVTRMGTLPVQETLLGTQD